VTLDFRPSGTLDLLDVLDRSEIDLAIGPLGKQGERFSRQLLLRETNSSPCCARNHPAMKTARVSVEELFHPWPHLEIFIGPPCERVHRSGCSPAKACGGELPLPRTISVGGADFDCVRHGPPSFHGRIAAELVRDIVRLAIRALSQTSALVETAMIWPRRLDNQTGAFVGCAMRSARWLALFKPSEGRANGLRSVTTGVLRITFDHARRV